MILINPLSIIEEIIAHIYYLLTYYLLKDRWYSSTNKIKIEQCLFRFLSTAFRTVLVAESALARRIAREKRCPVVGLLLSSNLQANRVQRLIAAGIMGIAQVVMGSKRTYSNRKSFG